MSEVDKKGRKWTVVDTLFLLGAGLISGAAALWAVPVGLFVAGGFCILAGFLIDSSGGSGGEGK